MENSREEGRFTIQELWDKSFSQSFQESRLI